MWSSGALPAEASDFRLMREMHWSWAELQATPTYVRVCAAAFLSEEAAVANAQHERSQYEQAQQQAQNGY